MIKKLYVDNYKCLVDFTLELEPLTLLLGTNGAGKSAVLNVVFALRELLRGAAAVHHTNIFPIDTLTRWESRDLQVFGLDVVLNDETFGYRLEVKHRRESHETSIHLERLTVDGGTILECKEGAATLYRGESEPLRVLSSPTDSALARAGNLRHEDPRLVRFLQWAKNVMVCAFYPASMSSVADREDLVLDRDGRNFAAWYRNVRMERPSLLPAFEQTLKETLDGFWKLEAEKRETVTRVLKAHFEHSGSPYAVRFDELSDGQRMLIVLYALVSLAGSPGYSLFLDEPENFLALREIQPWLGALSEACGDTIPQAVLCSHNPELIDYLAPDHGRLLVRENGVAAVRPLPKPREDGAGLKLSEIIARGWEQ